MVGFCRGVEGFAIFGFASGVYVWCAIGCRISGVLGMILEYERKLLGDFGFDMFFCWMSLQVSRCL